MPPSGGNYSASYRLTRRSGCRASLLEQAAVAAKEKGLAPLNVKTATKYVNNLSALLNGAEYEEYVERNPARRPGAVGPLSTATKRHIGFDIDKLNRIFDAPFYVSATTQSSRGGRFWVPLLDLWTGMRLGECVQLRTDDVARVGGGRRDLGAQG